MRILGIDPGSRRTGWGLVASTRNACEHVASGTFHLPARKELQHRLLVLAEGLAELLEQHPPDACAVERIFTSRNARTALVLGHARGVILTEVARRGIPLFEYTPMQVKQAVTGTGRAGKEQVQRMVTALLQLNRGGPTAPLQEDAADALALAMTHAAATRLTVADSSGGRSLTPAQVAWQAALHRGS